MIHFDSDIAGSEPQMRKHRDGNMIPMINMTFLLLLFFIVAGSFYETFAKEVLPPQSLSTTPASSMVEEFVMLPSGDLQWRGKTVTITQWHSELRAAGETPPAMVRVRADADTPAVLIIPMLDEFKQVAVNRVALVTVKAATSMSKSKSKSKSTP